MGDLIAMLIGIPVIIGVLVCAIYAVLSRIIDGKKYKGWGDD